MPYAPIEDHAIIGDLHTVALVSLEGSIDFLCFPDFDSSTVFAALLDAEKGGRFQVTPRAEGVRSRQMYLPDTNVLLTRFLHDEGIVELTDFMPISDDDITSRIIRQVTAVAGPATIEVVCRPAFDYARARHGTERDGDDVIFRAPDTMLRFQSDFDVAVGDDGSVTARFELAEGESAAMRLTCGDCTEEAFDPATLERSRQRTVDYWRGWIGHCTYNGRWREVVHRSALVLKLMTSRRHGSIVAAPTFGLPEVVGGVRNWDYRYCWIRDSAFTVYAFLRLGFRHEAAHYMQWIEKRFRDRNPDGSLQLMYCVDGDSELEESELDHLEGYRGSTPVRIGNGAAGQLQLDIYGELLDSVYLANKHVERISYDTWRHVRRVVDYVAQHWREPDEGIWEFRGGRRQFLHSRLMCWVAVDRPLRLAEKASLPAPHSEWFDLRNQIYESIFDDFWDEEIGAFVQFKDAKAVDASALLMPLVKFIGPRDPRWLSTLRVIGERLASDGLVHRYSLEHAEIDTFGKEPEGAFTMCSFWYIECLARAGELDQARLMFDKMIGFANHVGLYAEELGLDGHHLGNFPQAFTHLGLISAACALETAERL